MAQAYQGPTWQRLDKGALSSDWTGLSSHLIASFFPVEKKSNETTGREYWHRVPGSVEVQAPLTDGTIEHTINWASQFEGQGVDQRFGGFSALLQSGGLEPLLGQIERLTGTKQGDGSLVQSGLQFVRDLAGKSSINRLNSTQTFTGMPPSRIPVTAHFRALQDAQKEVHDPVNQLIQWALPQSLAEYGILGSLASKEKSLGLFESKVPQIIGMRYAGMLILPLVIEGIPQQITGPRTADGLMLHQSLTLSMATLSALDKEDWIATAAGRARNAP